MALPTSTDFLAMLQSGNLYNGATSGVLHDQLIGFVAAAIQEFQERTGQYPLVKDSVDVTRTYDPPGGRGSRFENAKRPVVELGEFTASPSAIFTRNKCGGGTLLKFDARLSSLTSVYRDITSDNPGGTLLTLGTDFLLFPYNAAAKSLPWTMLEFFQPFWGLKASVQVTGKWGYATIPDDMFKGILALAAYLAAPVIEQAITKAQISFKDKNQEVKYDSDPLGGTVEKWKKQSDAAVHRYKIDKFGN